LKAIIQSFCFSLALSAQLSAAPGHVDLTFDAGSGVDGQINATILAADGKIMIAGTFDATEHAGQSGVARLNPDGTTDLQFISAGLFETRVAAPGDDPVFTLAQTADGKTVIGGKFYVAGIGENICRLNADGSLDRTFLPPADWGLRFHRQIRSVVVQPDGNVLVGGNFRAGDGAPRNYLARLLPSGALDTSFNGAAGGEVRCMALQPDEKILVSGGSALRRMHPSGANDTDFIAAVSVTVNALAIQPDGKILVGLPVFPTTTGRGISRLNTNGTLDTNFIAGANFNGSVEFIKLQTDGKIIVGGAFTNIGATFVGGLARLQTNGVLDTSFASTSRLSSGFIGARSGEIDAGGKVITAGAFQGDTSDRRYIARFQKDGNIDLTFRASHGLGGPGVVAFELLHHDDERFIATITNANGGQLRRYFLDGTVDPHFVSPILGGSIRRLTAYTNGTVIALRNYLDTNSAPRYELVHFAADGRILSQGPINADGPVTALAVQADNKILIGGRFQNIAGLVRDRVARVALDGSVDPSFNAGAIPSDPVQTINVIAVTEDKKIYIGSNDALIRVNSNGSLDTSFKLASGSKANVRGLTILADGKILAFGFYFSDVNHSTAGVARYNPDGTLDHDFKPFFGSDFSVVVDIVLDKNGKIIVLEPVEVSRLNPDGSLDSTFPVSRLGPGPFTPTSHAGYDLLVQPDGNILVTGRFGSIQGQSRSTISRLFGEPVPIPLQPAQSQEGITLRWSNAALFLQSSNTPEGPYTIISSAKSPWLIPQDSTSAFFRLSSQ
jgi:uncharacterized delta-60 repeat protein